MKHVGSEPLTTRVLESFQMTCLLVFAIGLSAGCSAKMGRINVELPDDLPQTWATDITPQSLPITTSLLSLIDDDSLRELVWEALDNNPNLSATALRLKASEHLLYGPKSKAMPKLDVGFSTERNNQAMSALGKRKTESRHQISLGLTWEIDLWGRLADEHAAASQEVVSKREDYLLARDALAARVIQTWIDLVANRRAVEIEEERVEIIKRIENVLIDRFKEGMGNLDELSTAKSRTEIAKADLSARRSALSRSIRKLEVMVGRYPKGALLKGTGLPSVAPPKTDIPATALLNRPDIRAAMARVTSARHIASAAKKARLPSLQLEGQVFKNFASLGKMGGSTAHWSLLGAVFQPLFERGRLKNEAEARKLETGAELMSFRHVILTAISEVEDVLDVSKDLSIQIRAIESALKESEKSSRYYEERYRQGLESIQNLLNAREQEISVKNRLNELLAERLKKRIDLAMAVGAGMDDQVNTPIIGATLHE